MADWTKTPINLLMKKKNQNRWAWVLTGSGHFFNETINLINELEKVDLFISKAAEEVLIMYKKKGQISDNCDVSTQIK